MTTASFKLMPFPVSVAKSMAEGVFDRNGNGVLDPGDRILFSTFHRDVDGPLPPAFFDITSSNLADFSEMLISPRGFWLKRVHRKFGEASGRVHYWYAVENGRILIDQVQTLVMSPDGTCMSRVEGPKAREKRLCSEFERALFRPDAEDKIKFINERLLIDRHIQAVAELNRLQSEMTWLNITEGRVLDFDSAYRGYSFLFSHDGIEMLDAIIGGLERRGGYDRRLKEMRFYRSFLVGKWLAREVAGYVDTIRNAVLNSSVEWNGRDYPFYELDGLASEQKDEADRHAVMMLKGGLQREVFNPIFASREEHLFESVKRFYPSYLSFVSDMRHLDDLPGMIDAAGDFFDKTDSLYRRLMEAEAKRWSGGSGESMTRDDYLGLFSFPGTESRFPAKIMYPLIKELVTRMGFPQSRQKGDHKITIDDSLNPKKSSAPVALGVSVPNDIRISFRPQGGLRDYENLFHEIGHALHMAGTKVPEWIFRHLGDKTATESYAGIFGSLVTDPQFLEFYRDFVAGWNSSVSFEERVPVLTEAEMGRIVRLAALRDLYMVRRYNYAKVIFESARIGGAEEMLGRFGLNSCGVSKGAYALLFGKAYGMDMEEWEAERYLVEAEDDFYAADYARSFIVRPQLARKLREEFGSSWFVDGEAGRWLRENFFSQGNYFTPADLKERFDLDPNDYSEFERDLRWRLLAAERLEMGRGVPERP